mmetsp:Transcript_8579/g.13155  ORF Transcript_8579/g.13155 Transcript_8579/m.13155 type:complete len:713 (-) Transcript_8579:224-2362(-)
MESPVGTEPNTPEPEVEGEELPESQVPAATSDAKKKRRKRKKKKKGKGGPGGEAEVEEEVPLTDDCNRFPIRVVKQGAQVGGRRVVASRSISPGEVVLASGAYGAGLAVSDSWLQAACSKCLHITAGHQGRVIRCGGCEVTHYCSEQCQRADFPFHSKECKALKPLVAAMKAGGDDSVSARLAVRLAAVGATDKVRHPSRPLSSKALGCHFEHVLGLQSHLPSCPPHHHQQLSQAAESIVEMISPAGVSVSSSTLLHLLLAVQCNAHGVKIGHANPLVGIGLHPLGSMVNHSCCPNTHHYFNLKRHQYPVLEFRATKAIAEGEEITYSYVDLYQPHDKRSKRLSAAYHFTCTCPKCSASQALHSGDLDLADPTDPEVVAVGEGGEEVLTPRDLAKMDAMINGGQCNKEECSGLLCPVASSSNQEEGDASQAKVVCCLKCGGEELEKEYNARVASASDQLRRSLTELRQLVYLASDPGTSEALFMLDAARSSLAQMLAENKDLHRNHFMLLQASSLFSRVCEMCLEHCEKTNQEEAPKEAANGDAESGAPVAGENGAAEPEAEQGNPEEQEQVEDALTKRIKILSQKATCHAALYKMFNTCIGGTHPEMADQAHALGTTLLEMAVTKRAIPPQPDIEMEDVSVDWGDPHSLVNTASSLITKAKDFYTICLGAQHQEAIKAAKSWEFLSQTAESLFSVGGGNKKKKKGGKKKRN